MNDIFSAAVGGLVIGAIVVGIIHLAGIPVGLGVIMGILVWLHLRGKRDAE